MCGTGKGATERTGVTAEGASAGTSAGAGAAGSVGTTRGSRWGNVAALGGALAGVPVDPAGKTFGETTTG